MGSWALVKESMKILPAMSKLFLMRPSLIYKENLPYLWHRLKNHTLPLDGIKDNPGPTTYVGVTDEEIAAVTKEDIEKATYTKENLKPTKGFQVNAPPIVAIAKKLGAFDENVSRREYAERVFNFVRDNIKISFGEDMAGPYQDAVSILRSGVGVCFEQSALAVTLARAGGIPARCKIDFIKLPESIAQVVTTKYKNLLDQSPFFQEILNIFGGQGGPHMGLEFYVDGKWLCGETALEDGVQAALGNQLAEIGDEMIAIGMDSQRPITLMRYDSANFTIRFMKFMMSKPMLLLLKTVDESEKYLNILKADGEKIIAEAGGREKYKEMMRKKLGLIKPELPEMPSVEEIEEFRKRQGEIVVSVKTQWNSVIDL